MRTAEASTPHARAAAALSNARAVAPAVRRGSQEELTLVLPPVTYCPILPHPGMRVPGFDGSRLHLDAIPLRVELLGDQHRQGGVDPWPISEWLT